MVSDADVCCTSTVSNPPWAPVPVNHVAIWPVTSYRPLPRVETCSRWVCIRISDQIKHPQGETENRVEERLEYLPRNHQPDNREHPERPSELLKSSSGILRKEEPHYAETIQRRNRNQVKAAQ